MLSKKGFTLIELLIVIIIIGVLATLAIPQYTRFVERARAAEALTMIGALKTGEAAYRTDSGSYTTNLTLLDIGNAATSLADATSKGQYWYYTGTSAGFAGAAGYGITATRSTKSGGVTSDNIQFIWSDATGASWTGNHAGVPRS